MKKVHAACEIIPTPCYDAIETMQRREESRRMLSTNCECGNDTASLDKREIAIATHPRYQRFTCRISDLVAEMLFGVLFAGLQRCLISLHSKRSATPGSLWEPTFAGLPTFLPISFHLLFSYSLMALRRAWLYPLISTSETVQSVTHQPHPLQILRSACPSPVSSTRSLE
jgi:hypothetical protein